MVYRFAQVLLAVAIVVAAAPWTGAQTVNPWHNPDNPLDVDANGVIVPRDLLLIINRIQSQESPVLSGVGEGPQYFWDTSDDNYVTPRDALMVVNHLLATPAPEPSAMIPAAAGLFALAGYCWRRRRMRKRS